MIEITAEAPLALYVRMTCKTLGKFSFDNTMGMRHVRCASDSVMQLFDLCTHFLSGPEQRTGAHPTRAFFTERHKTGMAIVSAPGSP